MSRCADRHCCCGIKYPVRCTWPDGWEYRSIYNVRGLTRVVDGAIVRPALTLEFDPFAIADGDVRHAACDVIRRVFGQEPAIGITVSGSAKQVLLPKKIPDCKPSDWILGPLPWETLPNEKPRFDSVLLDEKPRFDSVLLGFWAGFLTAVAVIALLTLVSSH